MQNLLSRIKSYWLFIVLFLIVAVIVSVVIYLVLNTKGTTPGNTIPIPTPEEKIPTNKDSIILLPVSQNSAYKNATFNVSFTDTLPTESPVYILSQADLSTAFIQTTAKNFKFTTPAQKFEDSYAWNSQDLTASLSIGIKDGFINYTNTFTQAKPDSVDSIPMVTKPQDIVTGAKKILTDYKIDIQNTDMSNPVVTYFISYSEDPETTTDFSKANLFLVSFPRVVNGKKLYKQYGEALYTTITFDRLYTVKQATYFAFQVRELPNSTPLISTEEFKRILIDKKGIVRQPFSPLETVTSAVFTLTKATDGYLLDSASPYLVPIFIASGTVVLDNLPSQEAIVYSIAGKD